jgi:predicted Rossmann fold flavoprotein
LTRLKGVAAPVRLTVTTGTGRRRVAIEGAMLLTHFGVSGPAVLDVSRSWLDARLDDPDARLMVDWLPEVDAATLDATLGALGGRTPRDALGAHLPRRLVDALLDLAGVATDAEGHHLRRDDRRRLVATLSAMPLPVTGPRGWAYAEVTAGGVPLAEVHLDTMESRRCEDLRLAGEILDVDGRIGGFNFQWAWASGWVAGSPRGA